METKFNFKSAVCTSREQSERLLSFGLKKETADCGHSYGRQEHEEYEDWEIIILDDNWQPYWDVTDEEIPAWSLHRLWKLLPCEIPFDGGGYNKHIAFDALFYLHDDGRGILGDEYNLYDSVISAIEWLIKEGYFNKEYLV